MVETAVNTSMKKSYSAVTSVPASASAAPRAPSLDSRVMRKVFQDATEADLRASNVIVFGLTEAAEEDVKERVGEVLDVLGEKPHFEADRIGVQREGATRPVIVKLTSGVDGGGGWDQEECGEVEENGLVQDGKTVYICPDRTLMQRNT